MSQNEIIEMADGEAVSRPVGILSLPHALMIVDHTDGEVLNAMETNLPEHYWTDLLDIFVDSLMMIGVPREVLVQDERTRSLLKGLVSQMSRALP